MEAVTTVSIISINLARFLGFFMSIIGFGIAFNSNHMLKITSEIPEIHGMQLTSAMFPALIGSGIVAVHGQCTANWTCVVTVIGWLMVLGAFYRAWLPAHWAGTTRKCGTKLAFHIGGTIGGLIGLYLLYKGWINPS